MLTGVYPFSKKKNHYEMMKVILNGERLKIPEDTTKKLKNSSKLVGKQTQKKINIWKDNREIYQKYDCFS
jgi:hypothetical protein